MAKAIVLRELGGPENLQLQDVPEGDGTDDKILVRNLAIGVNFIDTYFRRGLYPTRLPAVLGDQGVGVVEACGAAVAGLSPRRPHRACRRRRPRRRPRNRPRGRPCGRHARPTRRQPPAARCG